MFMNVSVILYTPSFFYVKRYLLNITLYDLILYKDLNEVEKCNFLIYSYLFIR